MKKRRSSTIIVVAGGFILLMAVLQDTRTPSAVVWEPVDLAGHEGKRAPGLVLHDVKDGFIWASRGLSVYRSHGNHGLLKVHTVKPPPGLVWAAHFQSLWRFVRSWLGLDKAIDIVALNPSLILVAAGGEIQRIDLQTGKAEGVQRLHLQTLAEVSGVLPFRVTVDGEGRIYYGDYASWDRSQDGQIALFRSDDEGQSFEIAHMFSAEVAREISAVQWDAQGQALWVAIKEADGQGRIGFSRDQGETFHWIGESGEAYRTTDFWFTADHVDWLSAGDGHASHVHPSRLHRWNRESLAIRMSEQTLPGPGHSLQGIGGGLGLATTADTTSPLWLIGPDLDLVATRAWPHSQSEENGIAAIQLAREASESDAWLHLSVRHVREREPVIYRLPMAAIFASPGKNGQELVGSQEP